VHGQPCTGLTSDDVINPAAQLIPAPDPPLQPATDGKGGLACVGNGYPYLSIGEVCP
jgi:hypothetical protein